jgi:hypothetical protein
MSTFELPSNVIENLATAKLPRVYQRAVAALAECERLDEAAGWADKGCRIGELRAPSRRRGAWEYGQAHPRSRRAQMRRASEGIRRPRPEKQKCHRPHFCPTRREAAEAAGLSQSQQTTAARLTAIARPDFEAYVESPRPLGTALLAQLGRKSRLQRSERASAITEADLEGLARRHRSAACLDGLLKIAREARQCDPEDVVEAILDKRNQPHLSDVRQALGFVMQVKRELDKAAPQTTHLRPVTWPAAEPRSRWLRSRCSASGTGLRSAGGLIFDGFRSGGEGFGVGGVATFGLSRHSGIAG